MSRRLLRNQSCTSGNGKLAVPSRPQIEHLESRTLLSAGPRLTEHLGRGVVATRSSSTGVFVSWRSLAQDTAGMAFNVYRSTNGGAATKLNASPLTGGTNFSDAAANLTLPNSYFVKPVVGGVEQSASGSFTLKANATVGPFYEIPIRNITGRATDYNVKFTWVGDLDGDGEYDHVVLRIPTDELANLPDYVEAYKRDGTLLWAYNAGPNSFNKDNVEPGPSTLGVGMWDGVTVFDLDSDGKSEVVVRTADGATFGDGSVLSYPQSNNAQFLSVIDGPTGAERARIQLPTDYLFDGPLGAQLAVGYLDGVNPSLIAKLKNRQDGGLFNHMIVAYDFNGTLTQKWKFIGGVENGEWGHQMRVVDLDQNGTDEVIDAAGLVLSGGDGTIRYTLATQGIGHGDRFQIGDFDPVRPGLEGYGVQQSNPSMLAEYYYDATTGQVLHQRYDNQVVDVQRGMAADLDPSQRGYEYWSFYGIHNSKTTTPGQAPVETKITDEPNRPWPNMTTWWDGDLMGDPSNETSVDRWNSATQSTVRLTSFYNYGVAQVTKAPFYGDMIGDWREEIIFERDDFLALQVFTTQFASPHRLYSLAQNPYYRNGLTIKGYTQSNFVDYYLGDGMTTPPTPNIQPLDFGTNAAPTVATSASASPVPVVGTTVNLSVLGADDGGASALNYTWAAMGPGAVTYSVNGTNAAKNTTATFSAAGAYTFVATIRDAAGRTTTSRVNVTVNQTLSGVDVTPSSATIQPNATKQFAATGLDQFGAAMTTQPTFTWSVISGSGSINGSGLYTAPSTTGSATVRVMAGTHSDTGSVTISTDVVPQGWWKLDESSGTAVSDSAGNGYNGMAAGATWVAGRTGNALSFDGNDWVDLPTGLVNSSAGSVSLWVKTGTNFSTYGHLFYASPVTNGDGVGPEQELYVDYTSTEQINLFIKGATNVNLTTSAVYADNAWHHVAATWDINGNAVLYVDGMQTNSVAHNADAFVGSAVTRLGRPGAGSRYFTGQMDDVRLFNTQITASQVQAIFNEATGTPNQAPTVATTAAGSPSPVTGTTTNLSVLGADDFGEANLTYTWTVMGPAPVTFSANDTNAAKNAVATFTQAGTYNFTVTIRDSGGLSTKSAVSVTVNQTLTSVDVTPAMVTLNVSATQQFTATAYDQFGVGMSTPPAFTWSVASGGGTISSTGLYTAPATSGSATVRAAAGSLSDTGSVTITGANVPVAPTNLIASVTQKNRARLTWVDNASNETGFHVWSSRDGITWTLFATLGASSGTGRTVQYTSGSLARGTWYFNVTSYNANGDSTSSNTGSIVIP